MSFIPELAKTERTLTNFLTMTEQEVFDKFMGLPGAMLLACPTCTGHAVYVPGSRDPDNRVLLVAHYDTVWSTKVRAELLFDGTMIFSGLARRGIGADDRLGCAALWMLRNTGHSLLLVPDEESGCRGSSEIMENHQYVEMLKQHSFLMQFDRRGSHDYVTYDCENKTFDRWMLARFPGYSDTQGSFSDICALMEPLGLCGCNMSIGFYREHTQDECAEMLDFLRTTELTRRLLQGVTPRFEYEGYGTTFGRSQRGRGWWTYEDKDDDYGWPKEDKAKDKDVLTSYDYCPVCFKEVKEPEGTLIFPMCPDCGCELETWDDIIEREPTIDEDPDEYDEDEKNILKMVEAQKRGNKR